MVDKYLQRINHELDAIGNPIYVIRTEPIRDNELLYDRRGDIVAIKAKGKLLEILEGEE